MSRTVLILGNGPSAKLVDYAPLRCGHIESVGMNAAYRHWDRIDFRPTYYICMDSVLIKSHAGRIAELIREGRVKKFFLRDEFRELFPEFEGHERILWFDALRKLKGSLFDTNMITTGSWAIRWMAHEGKSLIATVGIDSNYVEILAQAERLGEGQDLRLELVSTPKFNPNYFFSDYQQAGDRYNIPNDPGYLQKTGQLVHTNALRQAQKDLQERQSDLTVVDCSPISTHHTFRKMDLDRFYTSAQISVVTSFFVAAPVEELENNLRIAVQNCENPHVAKVSILIEGERALLDRKIAPDLLRTVRAHEDADRLAFAEIDSRPDYAVLFSHARSLGTGTCAVVNSDILLDAEFLNDFLPRYAHSARPVVALTRWNRTRSGQFIQGISASPPWQEISLEDITYKEVNYLSYDAYIFDRRLESPPGIEKVSIGTFGCDTAIVGLLRVAGFAVTNPCLTHRIVHVDEKVRSYAGAVGDKQQSDNSAALREALLTRYAGRPELVDSLVRLGTMDERVVSFGTPRHRLGQWHSVFRMLGATPWLDTLQYPPVSFLKVEIQPSQVVDAGEELCHRLVKAMDSHQFLELEVHGASHEGYLGFLSKNRELTALRERLFRYHWQSVVYRDAASEQDQQTHADILLVLRQVLTLGESGAHGLTPSRRPIPLVRASAVATRREEPQAHEWPRLLIVDSTPVGHDSATGHLKQTLLGSWPKDRWMQLWETGGTENGSLRLLEGAEPASNTEPPALTIEQLLERCARFEPDVVYFRPIDSERLHEACARIVERLGKPLVLHLMDDWPERLRRTDIARHVRMDRHLRQSVERATRRLSVCDAMSVAYRVRYGGEWTALANGVAVDEFPPKHWPNRPALSPQAPFVLRYMGGLADDMNFASVQAVAKVVAELQNLLPIRLEVHTMPWYRERADRELGRMPGVVISGLIEADQYAASLRQADALLIAYNFDPLSVAYTQFSMANKMPECLASGVPVLAFGPSQVATIAFLKNAACAEVIDSMDLGALRAAILGLAQNLRHAQQLGERGRAFADAHLRKATVQFEFRAVLSAAAREVRLPVPHATPLLTSTPQPTVEPARTVQPSNALLSLGMIGIPEGQANFQRFSHGRSLHASGERRWRVAFDPDSAEPSTVSLEARFDLPASAKRGEFFGVVELGVDRDVEVEVKFVEPGAPPGGHPPQRLRVVAGVPCVTCLRTRFGPHSRSAALQLEIVAPLPGTQFTLGTVILIDTNMATASEPALRVANELFRSGGFDAALIMYLHLYSRTRLEMYARNALLCARQMRRTEQAAELT